MTVLWQILATSMVGSAIFLLAGFWTLRVSQGSTSRMVGRIGIGIGIATLAVGVTLAIFVVPVDSDASAKVTQTVTAGLHT